MRLCKLIIYVPFLFRFEGCVVVAISSQSACLALTTTLGSGPRAVFTLCHGSKESKECHLAPMYSKHR